MGDHDSEISSDQITFYEQQHVDLQDFESRGLVLDLGGGGEGIIGLLKGDQVIVIDKSRRELEEAPGGGLKIVMDMCDLDFLDEQFSTATSFYSLMYLKSRDDHCKAMAEVFRILRPAGRFLVWDVSVPAKSDGCTPYFAYPVQVRMGDNLINTGYGQSYPAEPRNCDYYVSIAIECGFQVAAREDSGQSFRLELVKE